MASGFPYANATSGSAARDEIVRILRRFGCERVGFMDEFDDHAVLLQFEHRGRPVQLRASAKGWAAAFLKENPHSSRMRKTKSQHESGALNQGMIAVNSILRDWVKGQMTAVECGIFEFDAAFMPFMLLPDGRRVIDAARDKNLLPAPKDRNA